tara:strand:- start:210 stop:317 length:108 start_codon:yes stop_codon:yes gene_type:complete
MSLKTLSCAAHIDAKNPNATAQIVDKDFREFKEIE